MAEAAFHEFTIGKRKPEEKGMLGVPYSVRILYAFAGGDGMAVKCTECGRELNISPAAIAKRPQCMYCGGKLELDAAMQAAVETAAKSEQGSSFAGRIRIACPVCGRIIFFDTAPELLSLRAVYGRWFDTNAIKSVCGDSLQDWLAQLAPGLDSLANIATR